MDSLLEHDEDWYQNVLTSLAPSGLLELTTLAADFPDITLYEFWATFELDEHKRRQRGKVVSFYLGGVYKSFTYDEFAVISGSPASTTRVITSAGRTTPTTERSTTRSGAT